MSKAGSITCAGKKDGAGAQALAVITTQAFAAATGVRYIHTPFSSIAHNDDNDPHWAARWERFFNLGEGAPSDPGGLERVELKRVMDIDIAATDAADRLYVVQHALGYTDANPDAIDAIRADLRDRYNGPDADDSSDVDPDVVNVAVHIRRGDVSNSGVNAIRYTDNERIKRALDNVLDAIKKMGETASVTIYSEGSMDDFADFVQPGVQFNLGGDAFLTYHRLVSADVLLMAKSAYSYSAAILSHGACVYEPYHRTPLADWIALDDTGDVHRVAFTLRLRRRLAQRRESD